VGLITVQVTRVRKFRQVTAVQILPDGSHALRKRNLAIQFPKNLFEAVESGTVWDVDGEMKIQSYKVNGWDHTEDLLVVDSARYKRLSGEVLAYYLTRKVDGVGSVIASRVARIEGIENIIHNKDVSRLCQIKGVDAQRAYSLINFWPDSVTMDAIEWVQKSNMSPSLGRRMIEIFGPGAIETTTKNPFLLLALGATWGESMSLATSLGFSLDSPEVLCAVAEKASVNLTRESGDIAVSEKDLLSAAYKLIKRKTPLKSLVDIVLSRKYFVRVGDDGVVPTGAALIEDTVARAIARRIQRNPGNGSLFAEWEKSLTKEKIREALYRFSSTLSFDLTSEQQEAVIGSVLAPVACISGGAGTGKTTILQAVLAVYENLSEGLAFKQVALSGRAAQRMTESTNREASTIAKFIADHVGDGKQSLPDHILLVVDEASMIDLLSMYRLCGILPEASRLLFVGDVAQLPPVGPGLIFHSLTKPNMPLPTFSLSQVKRQREESGIANFAATIRSGKTCVLPLTEQLLTESEDATIETEMNLDRAYSLWCQAGGRRGAIMLSPVRKGSLGVKDINEDFQKREGGQRPLVKNPEIPHFEWRNSMGQWLFQGDPVMINKNDYELDVRNGDLGYISEVFESITEEGSAGTVMLDSGSLPLTVELLNKLELAYAITVHKSQGSQWSTVIMTLPPQAERMTDQALLYTGATRPTDRLIIIGEQRLIDAAVKKGNTALSRKVSLGGLISQYVSKHNW
jgi:exodeoxyribonuclease V alpha subunit